MIGSVLQELFFLQGVIKIIVLIRVVESVFKTAGVGVGFQNCWSRSRFSKLLESESVFKTAGVGVGFSKLLELESGVRVCFVAITDSYVY